MDVDAEEQVEELLEVPGQEVGAMIGKGGNLVKTVQQRSGAQVKLERHDDGGYARITGTRAAVKKACVLLKSMLAFRDEVEPGGERLIGPQGPAAKGGKGVGKKGGKFGPQIGKGGKCFPGFPFSNIPPGTPGVNFGKGVGSLVFKSSQRPDPVRARPSLSAQKAWLAQAPPPRGLGETPPGRPLLLAISCCWPAASGTSGFSSPGPVLEFPAIAICPHTGGEVGRFHHYVGSAEDTATAAVSDGFDAATFTTFPETLADFLDWLPVLLDVDVDSLDSDDFLFVTAGDCDVETAFPMQCLSPGLDGSEPVDQALQNFFCNRWSNLHDVYTTHCLDALTPPSDIQGMLQHLGMPIATADQRLCMDDAADVARILQTLMKRDVPIGATAMREEVGGPTRFVCRPTQMSDALASVPAVSPPLCVPNSNALVPKAKSSALPPSEALEEVETWLPTLLPNQPFPPLPPTMAAVPTHALPTQAVSSLVPAPLDGPMPRALESKTVARRALLAAAVARGPSGVLRQALEQASWAQLDETELDPARQLLEELEEEEREGNDTLKSVAQTGTIAQRPPQYQPAPLKKATAGGAARAFKAAGVTMPRKPVLAKASPSTGIKTETELSIHETVKEDPYSASFPLEPEAHLQGPEGDDDDTSPEYEPWEQDGARKQALAATGAPLRPRSRSPRHAVSAGNAAVAPWRMA